jgi:LmbE family N-acetylglucosaminyl deacetylase
VVRLEKGPACHASGGVIQLSLPRKKDGEPLRVLCLGAHSDDIEIGCGGTILCLREQYQAIEFHWVVFSAVGIRGEEAKNAAELFVGPANLRGPVLKSFHDGYMPFEGAKVKDFFEEMKLELSPDLIFTHNRKDAHQDHRLICELTWNTFRDSLVLEYEIPKYDGDVGQPGVFVPLATELYQKKVENLMDAFRSQRGKSWFQPETFLALMRLRGMECNAPSGYAEAFYCRKLVL